MKQQKNYIRKQEWLARALDILAKDGSGALTIDHICREMGVSRGSFYWHFASRDDFRIAVMDYWFEQSTRSVASIVEKKDLCAEMKLELLIVSIYETEAIRYDLPIRAWASKDAKIQDKLEKVDAFRYKFARNLFSEIGFTGADLELRSEIFVRDLSSPTLNLTSRKPNKQKIQRRVRFYTRE